MIRLKKKKEEKKRVEKMTQYKGLEKPHPVLKRALAHSEEGIEYPATLYVTSFLCKGGLNLA